MYVNNAVMSNVGPLLLLPSLAKREKGNRVVLGHPHFPIPLPTHHPLKGRPRCANAPIFFFFLLLTS